MSDEMTLVERLRNPQWELDGKLAGEFNVATMRAAAEILDLRLPCEVWVEPGTMIKKGAPLESLLIAIQGRC